MEAAIPKPTGSRMNSETMLSLALIGVVAIMLVPLPPIMLDLLIAINLCSTLLLLLITLGVTRALDLSTFPSLLLMMTLYRLSLNVASTRRILLSADGGSLVAAFGNFVVGGNLIVGFVVFLILVIIQFIVITKGAGRVSEVSARFTLDALPGKQVSIDQDLNAGSIDEKEAKKRREELGRETEFYGAMDGASKFVRGDAIAGVIITAINLLGGIILGVTNGLSFSDSIKTYSILTIGDGLVSQIPALLIAVASGILVTKMTTEESLGAEIGTEFMGDDRPLWIGIVFVGFLILVPGLPKFPFIVVAALLLLLMARRKSMLAAGGPESDGSGGPDDGTGIPKENNGEEIRNFLMIDRATIQVGERLASLVKPNQHNGLADRIKVVRQEFSQKRGLWIPPIRVRSNLDLPLNTYRIVIAGRTVGSGTLMTEKRLAIPPENCLVQIPGEPTTEPVFGLPALWIDPGLARQAESHGYTLAEPVGILITHLEKVLRQYGHELLSRETLTDMLKGVEPFAPTIVEEIKSESVRMSLLHQVVKQLAADSISLADFALVLEAVANHAHGAKTANDLTDAVRTELGQMICERFQSSTGELRVVTLEPQLEAELTNALHDGRIAVPVEIIESMIQVIGGAWQNAVRLNQPLAVLTDQSLRRPLRRLLASEWPELGVICYQELPQDIIQESAAVIHMTDVVPESMLAAAGAQSATPDLKDAA